MDDEEYIFLREIGKEKSIAALYRGGSDANVTIDVKGLVTDGSTLTELLRGQRCQSKQGKVVVLRGEKEIAYLLLAFSS